jgi:ankyrin repeat protein
MLGRPCQEVIDFLETPTAVVIAGEIVFSDDVSRLVERLFSFWAESEKGNAKRILGLHLACHFGIKYAVEHLLAIGHEPDTPNPYGRTPLSLAAAHGYDEIILLLLETGEVDADTRDTDGHSPLSWAARKRHLSTVKLLLGIDADDATQRLFDFTWTKRAERERALQSAHSDRAPEHEPSRPNRLSSAVDDDSKAEGTRWSPLFEAVHGGDAEIVKIFLARGVSVAAEEHRGRLPLHIAASMGHIIVTKLLLDAGSDAEHRDEDGRTPLSIAVASSRAEIVQVLLQAHVDVDAKDKEGKTPLHSHPDNGLGAFTALLDHGAKVDIKDHKSRTALHAQVKQLANEPLAELLLEHGADVDAADAKGMTALGRARSGRAVEVLLAHGADTKVRDKAGRTVLCQGKKSADAVKMLLGRGLAFDARCDAGRAPLSHVAGTAVDPACVTALIEAGASVDETDYKGRTPLWHSANLGGQRRVDVAKELLARGASVDHLDVDGVSALRAAVSNNLPAKEEMVKLLVEAGASYDGFEDHERKYIDDALSNSLWVPAPKVDEEDEDVDHPQCPLQ